MKLLNGTCIKEELLKSLEIKVKNLAYHPSFAVIQVGGNKDANTYIREEEKMATRLGYRLNKINLDSTITEPELIKIINKLNKDSSLDGIMVQLPLPKTLNQHSICDAIDYDKDIDGQTSLSAGRLVNNLKTLMPATVKAIITIINYYQINIKEKHIVVLGRSKTTTRPLVNYLLKKDATVTICHTKTKNIKDITRQADILITAIGKPNYIDKSYLKKDVVIIDVGINYLDNHLCGDVLLEDVSKIAKSITPVPGGVGPVTVASLAENIYQKALNKTK